MLDISHSSSDTLNSTHLFPDNIDPIVPKGRLNKHPTSRFTNSVGNLRRELCRSLSSHQHSQWLRSRGKYLSSSSSLWPLCKAGHKDGGGSRTTTRISKFAAAVVRSAEATAAASCFLCSKAANDSSIKQRAPSEKSYYLFAFLRPFAAVEDVPCICIADFQLCSFDDAATTTTTVRGPARRRLGLR